MVGSDTFINEREGYAAGTAGTILKTTDGGTTWLVLSSGTDATLNSVCFTDTLYGCVAGSGGNILLTIDGGATWTKMPCGTNTTLHAVCFTDAHVGYIAGGDALQDGIILKTTDGGATRSITNSASGFTVMFFNVKGEKVLTSRCRNQNVIELDLGGLPKGVYFVQIQADSGTEIKKVVVQ